jgi:hypothetical protein
MITPKLQNVNMLTRTEIDPLFALKTDPRKTYSVLVSLRIFESEWINRKCNYRYKLDQYSIQFSSHRLDF